MAPYDVFTVSRYVIYYSNKKEYDISNLKLQKILYFMQAFFLIENGIPCFYEKIEAWDIGPIVPEVYRRYAPYASCNIYVTDSLFQKEKLKFLKEDTEIIRSVVDKFADYSATDLMKLTRKQAPWRTAYSPYVRNEILVESIKNYFRSKQQ